MRKNRILVLPFVLLFALGCLCTQVQNIGKQVTTQIPGIMTGVSTQMPAILTSVSTAQGMIETMAAAQTPSNCGTPSPDGLGIALERAKMMLQASGQFMFTNETVEDQPAVVATLASGGASTYPAIADEFYAQFIGDPCNLSKIRIKAPYTDDQATVDQGLAVSSMLFATIFPVDVQFPLMAWLAQNYGSVPESSHMETTIKNMKFELARSDGEMELKIEPED